jgi:hypothetical protein
VEKEFDTPHENWPRWKTDAGRFDKRNSKIINEFPALQLLLVLKNKISYGGGMWDLCKIIRYFGFR